MRTHTVLCVILFHFFTLSAQVNFQRTYGGVGNEQGHAIITTQDGGYAIAGFTSSFGAGASDIFILKLDISGIVQWQKTFGSALADEGLGVAILETPDNGLVLTGLANRTNPRSTTLYLLKTDQDGNLLWDNSYESGPDEFSGDHGRGLKYTSDGGILVFGTEDANTFGSNDGLILKVDANGNLLWKKAYGGEANDHLHECVELSGGNVLVCGSSESFGPGNTAGYLLKIDVNGNILWDRVYGGNALDGFNACDATPDFGIITTGITTSHGAGQSDVLLCKIDSSGTLQWTKTFGGPLAERGASVKSLADGSGYLIGGFTDSYGNGGRDILIIRTDSAGDLLWSKTLGTQGFEAVNDWANTCLQIPSDTSFVLTGWSDSLSIGGQDVLFINSDMEGSIFCNDASIIITSPDLTTLEIASGVASPGTYAPFKSIITESAMIGRSICYCAPECEKCEFTVVHYDLNDCYSNTGNGSDMDYSEFVAVINPLSYAEMTASILHREANQKHSCTPGVANSVAMCVSSFNSCFYVPGSDESVVFELTITPAIDSAIEITGISFFEKAPLTYNWINGPSGLNNYPTVFAFRVVKNGTEIFLVEDVATGVDAWLERSFDFTAIPDFVISSPTTLRFEFLGYCPVGNGATVAAWDLDELRIFANCDPVTDNTQNITGFIRNEIGGGLGSVQVSISDNPDFLNSQTLLTDDHGRYEFENIDFDGPRYLKGYYNSDFLNGVSTLDLIHIQKHLLGLSEFQSPYQWIAADANNSQSVSALDLVVLRQLILGRINSFPNNTSWRYPVANQNISLSHPWGFHEIAEAQDAAVDIGNAHFTGVKIGDVTNDATIAPLTGDPVTYRGSPSKFSVVDQPVVMNQPLKIDFFSTDLIQITGFQLAIELTGLQLQDVVEGTVPLTAENYHISPDGKLYFSWNHSIALQIHPRDVLFSLVVLPERQGNISTMVDIDNGAFKSETYLGPDLVVTPLQITFQDKSVAIPVTQILDNVPNPFSRETTVRFYMDREGPAELRFYDVQGYLLWSMVDQYSAGVNELSVFKYDLGSSSGFVYCQLLTESAVVTHKMVLVN